MPGLTYESSGVDYDRLDAFKRLCQQAAGGTTAALQQHGFSEPAHIRGESAYLIEAPDRYLAHVEEGLGTKNLIADAMLRLTGESFYHAIGVDTVATIVNDLITTGALPISVAMHAAVGDASWFDQRGGDSSVAADLAAGFADGCRRSHAVWGGGETPTLRGIVQPGAIVLAGSALGQIAPKSLRIAGDVRDGDAIVLLASSGVHTNGLTLCRSLAERVPGGYLSPLADGRTYGAALLDASVIYVDFVAAAQRANLKLNYVAHITGHGWRKLMRLGQPFVYRVSDVGQVPEVFRFIMQAGPVDLREAYGTFNMGAGFAAYVSPADAQRCVMIAQGAGYTAWVAGRVCSEGGRRAVEIEPLGICFESDTLNLRQ